MKQNVIANLIIHITCLVSLVIMGTIFVYATPSETNKIKLQFIRVTTPDEISDKIINVGTNKYEYTTQPLNDNDRIRYSWEGAALDVANAGKATTGQGYLKIYLGDDSNEANLIRTFGTSPLYVRDLLPKIQPGKNVLLFVYIDNNTGIATPATKVEFTFNYKQDAPKPAVEVVSPPSGTIFASDISKDFLIKLTNFSLEKENSSILNRGKMNLYYNEIKPENLLQTFTASVDKGGYQEVVFNSSVLDKLSTLPDNLKTKLIFELVTSAGTTTNVAGVVEVATNYGGTVDFGLPQVKVLTPDNQSNVSIDYKFKLSVKNFDLLTRVNTQETKPNQGYLQIRVDDKLVLQNTDKIEFTLRDLTSNTFDPTALSGQVKVRIDLVNPQFEKLSPQVFTETVVQVKKDTTNNTVSTQPQSNTWRLVIMGATILLILGSIVILITRG